MRRLLKDKRGISPVITTVILVAVGIALAVAIGLWMSGLVATFTRFEKLEVTSAYAVSSDDCWEVHATIKNTGSADATITSIMVNGVPIQAPITSDPPVSSTQSQTLPVGSSQDFTLTISATGGSAAWPPGSTTSKLTSGVTVNIVFHSAAGKDYPTSVTLP